MIKKAAWEIPPSALTCLSLGLLIGSMLMPANVEVGNLYAKCKTLEMPSMVPTLVDVKEGRLLERSLEDLVIFPSGTHLHEFTDLHNNSGDRASKELEDITKVNQQEWYYKNHVFLAMPDGVCLTVAVSLVFLGVIISHADFEEMSEEETLSSCDVDSSGPDSEVSRNTQAAEGPWHVVSQVSALGVLIPILALLLWSASPHGSNALDVSSGVPSSAELRTLINHSHQPVLTSDTFTMLLLVACAMMGVACVQSDHHEMTEQLQHVSEAKLVDASPTILATPIGDGKADESSKPRLQYVLTCVTIPTILFAAVSASMVYHCFAQGVNNEFADFAGARELRALLDLASNYLKMRASVYLDIALAVVLSTCGLVGLGCTLLDYQEMVQHFQTMTKEIEVVVPTGLSQ